MIVPNCAQNWPIASPNTEEQTGGYQQNEALYRQLTERTEELQLSIPILEMEPWTENARENGGVASRYSNIECPSKTAIDVENHQYIHANRVGMGLCDKHFVAAQLPVPQDQERFWKYAFDSGCTIVDLMTRATTSPHDQYYPREGEEVRKIGDTWGIVVEIQDCENTAKDCTTRYTVSDKTGATKTITRYHYMEWQDDRGLQVSELQALVDKIDTFPGTVLVHCSAGVGRTGTLIAAYCAKQQILAHTMTKENVDEKSIENLLALREQRGPLFVKTKAQFDLLMNYSHSLLYTQTT
jgi:protein tyrosine phosphatase